MFRSDIRNEGEMLDGEKSLEICSIHKHNAVHCATHADIHAEDHEKPMKIYDDTLFALFNRIKRNLQVLRIYKTSKQRMVSVPRQELTPDGSVYVT